MSHVEEQALKLALKLAELIPRYSWAVFALSSFILFIPEENDLIFRGLPLADYPFIIAERNEIDFQ